MKHNLITRGQSFRRNKILENSYIRFRQAHWKRRAIEIENLLNLKERSEEIKNFTE
ncbi:MAG: hypothetical protein IKW13_00510 [Thermoguttaceae bacterium]|nr:hypothetical protein [Thermoguttaceae bacterium]MBR5242692.1 hypothetical protein [Thermoguttaceae bacterium]